MFDQQALHDFDELVAPSARRGWVALVSTTHSDLAERYEVLLERAEIPFLLEETPQEAASDGEPAQTIAFHVHESCFDRACEVVARDHAETSDGRDEEEDEVLDDDDGDDLDDDLDGDDDGHILNDSDDDDVFDDDGDDHVDGEPDEP